MLVTPADWADTLVSGNAVNNRFNPRPQLQTSTPSRPTPRYTCGTITSRDRFADIAYHLSYLSLSRSPATVWEETARNEYRPYWLANRPVNLFGLIIVESSIAFCRHTRVGSFWGFCRLFAVRVAQSVRCMCVQMRTFKRNERWHRDIKRVTAAAKWSVRSRVRAFLVFILLSPTV